MTAPELLGGRYELRGVLGRGGMAEVRDGWDTRLDRAVAIKLMHPVLGAQPETRTRFESTQAQGADDAMPSKPVNWILERLFASEAGWLKRGSLPFGLSIAIIARKP